MKQVLGALLMVLAAGCGASGPGGKVEAAWGHPGKEAGNFVKPRGLAVDPARGLVYVADMSGRIQKFTSDGGFLASWQVPDTELGTSEGMTVTAAGELLVADTHYHRILRYNPQGEPLRGFGERGEGPGQLLFPVAIALDAAGNIFVAGYGDNRVQKFDPQGRFLLGWGALGKAEGRFERPSGLAIERDGNVLVADAANHRIQRFTPEGRLLAVWGRFGTAPGELHYPYDVAALSDGTCAVAENYNHRIQRFAADGRPLGSIGRPGRELGEFARPWCLAVGSAGTLYVSDTLNHRVQVLRLPTSTANRSAHPQITQISQASNGQCLSSPVSVNSAAFVDHFLMSGGGG